MIPKTFNSLYVLVLTTARIAAFMPGESPPEVITPIVEIFFIIINTINYPVYLRKANKDMEY